MRPVIDVQGVSVIRGDVTILDKISMRVEPDQHWAVLGPNGSGKTSLLSILARYIKPNEGTVEVMGLRYGDASWHRIRGKIGMVSSSLLAQIDPNETALEIVISGKYDRWSFWKRLFSNDRRRGLRVLRFVQCRELANRKWGVLSQGEKQRVLIGRALMPRPRLLILDEPCAGLDFLARERFLRFLRHFGHQKGAPTLLMATHYADEIPSVFKHVLILKKGRVSAAGEIAETLNSDNISTAFGSLLRIEHRDHHFHMARRRSAA